ncbi:FRG domain-containing protein [Maridesulfovibrio zosterae]|uniref:FRG domain-containing protein n=1 Tax=Maridesulfovibrio zosterae TaxID=82171 RepID=UPI000401C03A|nr:FRG domain-containing protein [Maridesulfovibrio zosterae]
MFDFSKNKMTIDIISSWSEFEELIREHTYRDWIYRGQSCAKWGLESSLERTFKDYEITDQDKGQYEIHLLEKFKAHSSLFLSNAPEKNDKLEWLSLMQHHGAPTRLLDWSFSPYVACFFAADHANSDFAVFCLNPRRLAGADENYYPTTGPLYSEDEDILKLRKYRDRFFVTYEPKFVHQRALAQQGLFTAVTTYQRSYGKIFEEYVLSNRPIFKIVFKAEFRKECIDRLKKMNISSTTLFPDLDGFCSSLKHDFLYLLSDLASVE